NQRQRDPRLAFSDIETLKGVASDLDFALAELEVGARDVGRRLHQQRSGTQRAQARRSPPRAMCLGCQVVVVLGHAAVSINIHAAPTTVKRSGAPPLESGSYGDRS